MFTFFKKNKLKLDILYIIVFAMGSAINWYDYFSPESKKMDLFAAVVFGLMAIIKTVDVVSELNRNKNLESKQPNR